MDMISKSPDRHTFQHNAYIKTMESRGQTVDNNDEVKEMDLFYKSLKLSEIELENNPEWQINNLEYDLRSTTWILEKTRNSDSYAQHLYSALCNNSFVKNEVWPILQDNDWCCSWRHAGGIIADMREQGDYIDWYCSGSSDYSKDKIYVPEGEITEEIRNDLFKLGWIVK